MERGQLSDAAQVITVGEPDNSGVAVGNSDTAAFLLVTPAVEPFEAAPEILLQPLGSDRASERVFDLVVATALLLAVMPLMVFCAAAVLVSSRGPLLYRQTRVGRHGETFSCLKFRTMTTGADSKISQLLANSPQLAAEWQATYKMASDPRVTWMGRFLRRYCLDELPQLANVLAGHMSIVGPRPIVADEIARYGAFYQDYCSVRPGLTGLWQISGRHRLSYEERVRLDAQYTRSKSVALDARILLKTIPIVLCGDNF